jgi:hypothetical protein
MNFARIFMPFDFFANTMYRHLSLPTRVFSKGHTTLYGVPSYGDDE